MNKQTTPFIETQALVTASATSGTFNYNMEGIGRASLQLNSTLTAADTWVITLKLSVDGVNFVAFSTAKTVTFTGGTTDHAVFELGTIDYPWLQVSWAATSAHTGTMTGNLYGVDGRSAF